VGRGRGPAECEYRAGTDPFVGIPPETLDERLPIDGPPRAVPHGEERLDDVARAKVLDHLQGVRSLRRVDHRQVLEGHGHRASIAENLGRTQAEEGPVLRTREERIPQQHEPLVALPDRRAELVALHGLGDHRHGESMDVLGATVARKVLECGQRPLPPVGRCKRVDDRSRGGNADHSERLGDRISNDRLLVRERLDERIQCPLGIQRGEGQRRFRADGRRGIGHAGARGVEQARHRE
jgi:hypothetical protein